MFSNKLLISSLFLAIIPRSLTLFSMMSRISKIYDIVHKAVGKLYIIKLGIWKFAQLYSYKWFTFIIKSLGMKWNITNVRVRNTRYISPPVAMHTRESSIHNILYAILVFILYKNKSVNFRSLHLSFEVLDYLYESKSTEKPTPIAWAFIGFLDSYFKFLKVSSFQNSSLAYNAILNMSGNGCALQIIYNLLIYNVLFIGLFTI